MKRLKLMLAAIVLLILSGIVGSHYYEYYSTHVSTDDAFIKGHVIPLSFKVAGHVIKVHTDDNLPAREGELLVELDPPDYQAKYDMRLAERAAAEAKAAQAAADVERYKKLTVNAEISKQELDHSIVQAKIADAELNNLKAVCEQAALELSYTRIYAPSTGTITQKSVEAGGYVQVGQTLMTLVTPERWVIANLKETDLTKIRPGQPVEITVDTYPDKVFKGHVDSIQSGTGSVFSLLPPEDATGNFVKVVQRVPVKIVFDDPPDPAYPLALGMSVIPVIEIK